MIRRPKIYSLGDLAVLVEEDHVGSAQGGLKLEELVQPVTLVDGVEVIHRHCHRKVNPREHTQKKTTRTREGRQRTDSGTFAYKTQCTKHPINSNLKTISPRKECRSRVQPQKSI